MTIQNPNVYESLKGNYAKKVQIVIEVALDPVTGWGDNVEDHIQLMFKHNPYIISATPQRQGE